MLKESFNIDNEEISKAKEERIDKQYYIEYKATKEDVEKGIKIAENFNGIIRNKIESLTENEIKQIREKLRKEYF